MSKEMTHEQRMAALVEAGEKLTSALLAAANARDTIALAAEIVKAAGEYAVVTSTQGPTSIADAAMAELDALLAEWNRETK